jgi:replication factor C small subunit
VLRSATEGDFSTARSDVDDLLDEGFDGDELLRELLRVARNEYAGAELSRLYRLAGEADLDLTESTDDKIHLTHLLTAWAAGRHTLRGEAEA